MANKKLNDILANSKNETEFLDKVFKETGAQKDIDNILALRMFYNENID